jgi:hypothetical protein
MNGGPDPTYMTNGTVYPIHMTLWNTSYIIAPGHAIRFAVTSSNYPRFSANPNNGFLLKDPNPGPNITANNIIYHSSKYQSSFVLPIVKKLDLPVIRNLEEQFRDAYPQVDLNEIMKKHPDLFEKLGGREKRNKMRASRV